ncbi:prenyltransferase/squalene oxidase repeat-containing protein [Sphaerisporangium rubeum]|uniref:Squalene-hopene/tetraprenyl-beta-curcumene cyclase n=1 Tax=Sphaerisporangium rubeum TaxID=321317 RepID=A0A7X0M7U8_9ACTN|nr:prenyltransferase/squalene oxidase repeat-containing protein [Sphaerisporangium rubeum]MBB6474935.1 squalene-hopene/tetraprenyl-beta-curcumene cyclase [Sphaerisporangium rubeum]
MGSEIITTGPHFDVEGGVAGAVKALWDAQRADGSWEGYLPSSAVSTAAVLIAFHVAGDLSDATLVERGAEWLLAEQNEDGGWADVPGGPSTFNGTGIAVSALRTVRPDRVDAITRATDWLERNGGRAALEDLRVTTLNVIVRVYLAFAGLYDPDRVKRIPIEISLIPHRLHQRVSFILPGVYAWAIMQVRTRTHGRVRTAVNRVAERRTLEYLRELAEFEGPDGGSEESAFMVALIVFGLGLAGVGDDLVTKYLRYMRNAVRPDGSWPIDRDLELSGTCYITQGMQEAGLGDDDRLLPTIDWIKASQRQTGLPATGCPPGGWGWGMPSSWPDVDDTSLALYTLAGAGVPPTDPHVAMGVDWLHAMRNTNGSWGCFIRNGRTMFDAPCSALTSHAILALNRLDSREHHLDRAVRWLAKAQNPDGSFSCVWFRDHTSGTARVLDALSHLGLSDHPVARACTHWLQTHQSPDGGWGDGAGLPPTAEETSWSVLALTAAGQAATPTVRNGIHWLLKNQREDGLWPGGQVGYYYNGLTYWCHSMVNGYALQALSRYRTH